MSKVLTHLDRLNIQIYALSIADAGEFGLVRIIVDDIERASKVLEDANYNLAKSRKNTEVLIVLINEKNKISRITKILGDNCINIDYAYSSTVQVDQQLSMIIRASNLEEAETILKENNVVVLSVADVVRK